LNEYIRHDDSGGSLSSETFVRRESPQEIERQFNIIHAEISKYVLNAENFRIPPDYLFSEFDGEFEKVKQKHEEYHDEMNLLHVESNYYSTKVYQYLQNDPTESLRLFLQALTKLLGRNAIRQYQENTLEKMLGTYMSTLIKISSKTDNVSYEKIEKSFLELLESYSSIFASFKKLTDIGSMLCDMFVEKYYGKQISYIKVRSLSQCEELDCFVDHLKHIEKVIRASSLQRASISKLYNVMYVTRKNQLYYFLTQMFFEKTSDKKQKLQVSVDRIVAEMIECSELSLKNAQIYINAMPKDKQKDSKVKLVIAQHEIDKLTAVYYKEAYSNKDILRAWKIMDQIKHLFVVKAFKDNLSFSEDELSYYSEEWTLLYVFAKICLLKEEVSSRAPSLRQEWEKTVFAKIASSLEEIKNFFKYELSDKKDYTLKIMTSTFAGSFSEYLIRELLQEVYDYVTLDNTSASDFDEMFACIKSASSKDDIILNWVIEKDQPDVDIYIKDRCAIFLKNAIIDADKMKKIWNEVTLCKRHAIRRVFYGFNFAKNVQKIEYIRTHFEKMNNDFQMHIEPFDIKDLVSVIFEDLRRNGQTIANFQELDLFRVLDY
jgi:hypothetical protein